MEAVKQEIPLKPVAVARRHSAWNRLFEVLDSVEEKKPRCRKKAKQEEERLGKW